MVSFFYDAKSNKPFLSEETLHYVAAFLDRYKDKNPSKHHEDSMKELRDVSNYLLENLGKATSITIVRHRIADK